MDVFISWSGERSRAAAEALRGWLPKIINALKPWLSSADIDKGARWSSDVALRLEGAKAGIICLTPSNLHSDWVLFEAGALSKTLQNTFVCPLLIGLEPSDVKPPLSQFQATKADRKDMLKLLKTLNTALGNEALPEAHIDEAFDVWWPKLDSQLKALPAEESQTKTHRPDRELLEELLALVRNQIRSLDLLAPSKDQALSNEENPGRTVEKYFIRALSSALDGGANVRHKDTANSRIFMVRPWGKKKAVEIEIPFDWPEAKVLDFVKSQIEASDALSDSDTGKD